MIASENFPVQSDSPTISVIIPTYNGELWIGNLLSMLAKQSHHVHEILVIDSSSTDSTIDIVKQYNVSIISVDVNSFDHGGTRSMAAERASGDILVFLTQDAIPADEQALARLVQPFLLEERVVACYGRQLPSMDANAFAEHLRLFNYPDKSYIRCWDDRNKYGFKTIFISNSFAAYRKDVLAAHGYFPERLIFGEDSCTVANLLEKGYCVAYVSDAKVYHSHNYSIMEDFRRYFDIGVFHTAQGKMLEKFGTPTGEGKRFVRSELSYIVNNKKYHLLPESIMRNGAKFIAYQLGKRYKSLPRHLAMLFSMHRRWWLHV